MNFLCHRWAAQRQAGQAEGPRERKIAQVLDMSLGARSTRHWRSCSGRAHRNDPGHVAQQRAPQLADIDRHFLFRTGGSSLSRRPSGCPRGSK